MYNSSIIFRERSRNFYRITFLRRMGGGPRTFPGGLNKWQWKRLHENQARQKEKRLLDQEKQLYQARVRSEIRSKLSNPNQTTHEQSNLITPNYKPLSPNEHIKTLADRFMKEGAEDLWNEADGPIKSPSLQEISRIESNHNPINLQKMVSGQLRINSNQVSDVSSDFDYNKSKPRNYSTLSCLHSRYSLLKVRHYSVSTSYSNNEYENVSSEECSDDEEDDDDIATGDDDSILSPKRFDECDVSPLTIKALTLAGYGQMTKVQDATISTCLEGKDALVAKTGPWKSAAFLIPAIETVLKASNNKEEKRLRVPPIHVLILCSTNELASQIAEEANMLLKFHDGIGVQTLVGGTRFKHKSGYSAHLMGLKFKADQKRLDTKPCHIIIATPGRLLDHIDNKSGFDARLMGLKLFILDEADHLLDLGFRKDVEKIIDFVPRQRQSLLFSATFSKEVRRVSQFVLKRKHAYINTDGLGPETLDKVNQSYLVAPHEQHFQIVHHILKDHIALVPDYKVIVFCTTSSMATVVSELLRKMNMNVNVNRASYSRTSQVHRPNYSGIFVEAKQIIYVTSDVSSSEMNYPDVTLVIQVGVPINREQYINRLGQTGREGKSIEGIMVLAPWEEYFVDEIKDLSIIESASPHLDPDMKVKIEESMAKISPYVREEAHYAYLGYYNLIKEKTDRDKTTLVELDKGFCDSIGIKKVPSLVKPDDPSLRPVYTELEMIKFEVKNV